MGEAELAALPGLGPASARWLVAAGVSSYDELERLGATAVHRRVRGQREGVSLNLLYALECALRGCHWRDLPANRKQELRDELAALDAADAVGGRPR